MPWRTFAVGAPARGSRAAGPAPVGVGVAGRLGECLRQRSPVSPLRAHDRASEFMSGYRPQNAVYHAFRFARGDSASRRTHAGSSSRGYCSERGKHSNRTVAHDPGAGACSSAKPKPASPAFPIYGKNRPVFAPIWDFDGSPVGAYRRRQQPGAPLRQHDLRPSLLDPRRRVARIDNQLGVPNKPGIVVAAMIGRDQHTIVTGQHRRR